MRGYIVYYYYAVRKVGQGERVYIASSFCGICLKAYIFFDVLLATLCSVVKPFLKKEELTPRGSYM